MKFGKTLKRQIEETLPEWRDKFVSYKELKKRVRLISSSLEEEEVKGSMSPCSSPPISSVTCSGSPESAASCGVESNKVSMEAASFIFLLDAEIEKFNSFFMEQEEEFIIRHKELQERIQDVINKWGSNGSNPSEVEYKEHMKELRKEMVNFHGEMVLLEYYSNVNYTGMAKILKKYDKRTGRLLRLPFIEKVSQQPFFTTDLLSKLVKDCENIMCAVFPVGEEKEGDGRRVDIKIVEESVFKNIVAALVTLKEIRRGSSTYSPFSLPPMNLDDQYPDPKDSFIL